MAEDAITDELADFNCIRGVRVRPAAGGGDGLERADFDGQALHLRGAAHAGRFIPRDQPTKNQVCTVPCPPSVIQLLL